MLYGCKVLRGCPRRGPPTTTQGSQCALDHTVQIPSQRRKVRNNKNIAQRHMTIQGLGWQEEISSLPIHPAVLTASHFSRTLFFPGCSLRSENTGKIHSPQSKQHSWEVIAHSCFQWLLLIVVREGGKKPQKPKLGPRHAHFECPLLRGGTLQIRSIGKCLPFSPYTAVIPRGGTGVGRKAYGPGHTSEASGKGGERVLL